MKHCFLTGCLLLAGCSTGPALTPQQVAVTAFIKANLPDATSYEPVRWDKTGLFRASEAAAFDLPDARHAYEAATTSLAEDSADYVLLSTTARQFHPSDLDVANAKQMYQTALTNRSKARTELRHLAASKDDTTRLGYRLFHVFRANTADGKPVLDSAGFLINLHGVIITNAPPRNFYFAQTPSNRDAFMGTPPPPPPPPPPMAPPTPAQLKAYLKEPMQR